MGLAVDGDADGFAYTAGPADMLDPFEVGVVGGTRLQERLYPGE